MAGPCRAPAATPLPAPAAPAALPSCWEGWECWAVVVSEPGQRHVRLCPCSQASSSVSAGPYRAPQTSGTTGSQLGLLLFPCCHRLRDGADLDVLASPKGLGMLRAGQSPVGLTSSAEAALPQPHLVPPGRTWWPQPGTSALEPPRPPSQGAASRPGAPGLARAAQNILGTTSLRTGGVWVPPTRQSIDLWGTAHGRGEPVG